MSATTHETRQAAVQAALKNISHIATLPEITLQIIELVEDSSSTAQDLHKIISHDPPLCSRILKVVNSAFYGLPRQIGSINRAIVLLGLNAVKNIAIAASLTKLFRGGELCPNFSARDLWVHSIATATAAKMICDVRRLGLPDEAFLAGLIHDIGIMVELQALRAELVAVVESLDINDEGDPTRDMREVEQEIMGADHCDFGSGLCESWKFPKSFTYVTAHHHDPLSLPESSRTLTLIVHLADRLAARAGFGFRLDLENLDVDQAIVDEIGLTNDQVQKIVADLPEAYAEVETTFG